MSHHWVPSLLATLLTVVTVPEAFADREPTEEERAAIETLLRAHGFESWDKIEVEDDGLAWEADVHQARRADGHAQDFEVESDTGEPPKGDSPAQVEPSV
jgi:hypothetical protein